MVAVNRTTKMLSFINHRIRATIVDGRQIVGRFVAFDRHMNLVLADSEEFRKLPKKKKTNTTTKEEDDEDAGEGGEEGYEDAGKGGEGTREGG